MASVATKLYAARTRPTPLAPLILMSDPTRMGDPVAAVRQWPMGAAVIYRHFGKADRHMEALRLRAITFERGQQLLIGADPDLAIRVGADGVHFRRDNALILPALWRQRCPDWIITMAGVKDGSGYQRELSVLDGLFVSSVFDSQSPSAGSAIGVGGLRAAIDQQDVPIIALGGVNVSNCSRLVGSGAAGIAGVSFNESEV